MDILDTITFDGNSPLVQADMWGIGEPYVWQQAIWSACWRNGAMVAVRTCNESGKSSVVIPVLAASFAAAFPASQVVITSASERQLKKQMEPSLKALFYNKPRWEILANEIKGPSIDGLPPSSIMWFATKGGDMFEGFHVKQFMDENKRLRYAPLLIIADEAKSVKKEIFTAIERCNPTIQLAISTTGEDSGDFYDACMTNSGLWTTSYNFQGKDIEFKIPWTMCPHLLKGTAFKRKQAMLQEKSSSDPDVMSILLAEFFRGGARMVFDESDLSAASECSSGMIRHVPEGGRKAFCDFSGGGDELTFGVRVGNMIKPLTCWHNDQSTPPSKTADKYISLFIANGLSAREIYGDNGGLGALIINELGNKGWPINRVNPNVAPVYKDGFVDRYSEMHWNFKSHIQNRNLILPPDAVLMNQMRLRRYLRQNSDENKIRMEAKENARKQRSEKSPDRLDTLVHLTDGLEVSSLLKNNNYSSLRCGTIKDTMQENNEGGTTDHMNDEW